MKRILLLLSVTIIFCFKVNAQLVADAGNNTSVCGGNSLVMGGSPTASGGTPPYTYAWSPWNAEIGDTTSANPLFGPFGPDTLTYYLTVTDNLSNQAFDTVTIIVFNQIVANAGNNDTICAGDCVTLGGSPTVIGGTQPFTYSWAPSAGLNGGNLANPTACPTFSSISYSLTVIDAAGCSVADNVTIFTTQNQCIGVTKTDAICFGSCNGTATVFPSGNYNYLWNDAATTATRNNLCAGTYTVIIMDSVLNPLDTLIVNITQPTQLIANTSSINVTCFGANNGAIVVTVSGGTPPYTYSWSNGSTTQAQQNLPAGTYSLTISDSNGCTMSANATVNQPNPLSLSTTSTDASGCGVCDGAIDLTLTGGVLPVTYLWSNSATTEDLAGICPGVYIINVTDANNCTDTFFAIVNALGTTLNVTTSVSGHVTCTNPNGSISASVSGGVPPYSYSWSTGDTVSVISNLSFGLYTVTITDSSGCQGFAVDTIFNQQSFSYYVYVTGTNSNCSNNGLATANVTGDQPPYTFLWNNSDTSRTITGLNGGTYSVTVTDSAGCQRTGSTFIHTSCYNVITGRIIRDLNNNCVADSNEVPMPSMNVRAINGAGTYYGTSNAQGYFAINVPAGTYHISVYNTGLCISNCEGNDSSYTHTFSAGGDTLSDINFYLTTSPANLYTSISSGNFRPGFNTTVYVYYGNFGIDTVDGTLTFTYDADLTYVSSSSGGVHNASNRTITWSLSDIPPRIYYGYYSNTYVSAVFLTPVGTPVGTAITNTSQITGPGPECNESDNTFTITRNVTNSQDPNDKQVSPPGDIYDEQDSVLVYTIRFQNTGNDTAWFIILKDTLSPYLEPASVQNLSSSHPITEFSVSGTGILTWVFNPIYLVDSFTNEESSHGYVMFQVKKKSGLVIGTEIKNTAFIYFDYNNAVVTNTVTSKVADPSYVFGISEEGVSVVAFPNPFSNSTNIVVEGLKEKFDFSLFDVAGRMLRKISSITTNQFELKREELSAGVYFYKLSVRGKKVANGKLVVE